MVEKTGGIEGFAIDAGFKVQVLGGGTSGAACESDGLSCPYPVALFAEVFGLVGIEGFQSVGMANDDGIAVGVMRTAEGDVTREGGTDGVVGEGLDVGTSVVTASAIRTDDFTARQGIGPVGAFGVLLEIDGELVLVGKGVLRRFVLQYLPLVNVWDGVLTLGMKGGTGGKQDGGKCD